MPPAPVALRDKERESAEVKAIAEAKPTEIDRKIAELASLRELLSHLDTSKNLAIGNAF
jgi:hypothetical protein